MRVSLLRGTLLSVRVPGLGPMLRTMCAAAPGRASQGIGSALGWEELGSTRRFKKKRKKQFLNLCPVPARWDGTGLPHSGRGVGKKISDLWPSSHPSLEIKESSCPEPRR